MSYFTKSGFVTKNRRFKCIGCGECCKRPGEVRFDNETFEAIASFLGQELEEFRRAYNIVFDENDRYRAEDKWVISVENDTDPCPFLVDDQCSIHEVRPRQCRTYPFWPEILMSEEAWQEEKLECPGIDIGPFFPQKDVEELLWAEINQNPVSKLFKLANVSDD